MKVSEPDQPTLRKRKGVVRASITHFNTRMKDLEGKVHEPATLNLAHRMSQKLDFLDADFKMHHYALIDVVGENDEAILAKEQETLD